MDVHKPARLIDRLRSCADLWCEANNRSLGGLSSVVMNHGNFFARFESPEISTTTATLERFGRFLIDPANWSTGVVPADVIDFARVVGIVPADRIIATMLPLSSAGRTA